MALPVVREPYTYQDLEAFPEDGKRREVIEGELIVTAAPSTRHQRLVGELYFQLRLFLRDYQVADVFMAPTEIVFDLDAVQPDICVVLKEGNAEITDKRIMGAPEWVIEVLSPATREYDLSVKRKLYANHGCIYWVIDTIDETLTSWDLVGKKVYQKTETAEVSLFKDFRLNLRDLFELA